jgi:hypothetical protein
MKIDEDQIGGDRGSERNSKDGRERERKRERVRRKEMRRARELVSKKELREESEREGQADNQLKTLERFFSQTCEINNKRERERGAIV